MILCVSLATKRVRVKTHALVARLLEEAVKEGTGLRELAGCRLSESCNSDVCV